VDSTTADRPRGLDSIHVRPGHPDFLDLPWHLPLSRWPAESGRAVEVAHGLSRHDVAFLGYGERVYVFKHLPARAGEREFARLAELERRKLPAVIPAGHAHVRDEHGEESSVLVTRFLDFSLPFRTLFMQAGLERYRDRLLDAMASLLVRLHLVGFYWGDCSLSNTLFRRDAGELQASLVDAETSEFQEPLGEAMRRQDLAILEQNVVGELADLASTGGLPAEFPVRATAASIRQRYDRLWGEITREESVPAGENYRIHERVRALNELGFSVSEIKLVDAGEGDRLRMRAIVTDRDYHRHLLHSLTGVVAGDQQAALMLNEIRELQATASRALGREVPMSVAAFAWLNDRYQPAADRLAPLLGRAGELPELYCQVLEHKWYLSEQAQRDVGLQVAIEDYVRRFQAV